MADAAARVTEAVESLPVGILKFGSLSTNSSNSLIS
jgi:hypothetical protein